VLRNAILGGVTAAVLTGAILTIGGTTPVLDRFVIAIGLGFVFALTDYLRRRRRARPAVS
jgi:hypothetical protein